MEKPKLKYSMKLGTIDQVLAGEGKIVDSCEDLFCSGRGNSIIIPKVIGVSQVYEEYENHPMMEGYNEAVQSIVSLQIGKRDKTNGDVISLVYDPDMFSKGMLAEFIDVKDTLRRVKLVGYDEVPNFSNKVGINPQKVGELLSKIQDEDSETKHIKTVLERDREYFQLNKENYGLTRVEALNYSTLGSLLRRLDGCPTLETARDMREAVLGSAGEGLWNLFNTYGQFFEED